MGNIECFSITLENLNEHQDVQVLLASLASQHSQVHAANTHTHTQRDIFYKKKNPSKTIGLAFYSIQIIDIEDFHSNLILIRIS